VFNNRRGQQSFLVIICIIVIILIVLFTGLGEFFGVASDMMSVTCTSGFACWFFSNWILVMLFMLFTWIAWMVFKG
jgi:hypothetical protein